MSAALLAISALAAFAVAPASAHMEMINPAPWYSKANPNTPFEKIEYSYTSPLDASGANFPCKGFNEAFGTPAGASVATWAPGSKQSFTLSGTATHGGGSCQASLSYDGGNTFKVIRSIEGECPLKDTWDFTVPDDAPAGEAVFAWTWFNRVGNREMYMNCATVTIGSNGTGRRRRAATPFDSLPNIFEANIGNGCSTTENGDVIFPDPGPDVLKQSSNPLPPVGNCGASSGGGSGSGSGSQSSAAPSPSKDAGASVSASAPASSSSSVSYNDGQWTPTPSATDNAASSSASSSQSSSSSVNDGQWTPSPSPTDNAGWSSSSASASASPSISFPAGGQWHNNGNDTETSATPSSSSAAVPSASSTGKKCNRRVRRHKKRVNHHGQVGSF